jgi:hypothetical protein
MEDNHNHVSGDQSMQAAAAPDAGQSTHPEQERVVPLAALESERAKRQQLEDDNRMMREHFALMQAQAAQPRPPAPPPQDEFSGMQDSDVLTVGDLKKHSQRLATQFGMTIEELRMTQRHPDYQQVVATYLPELFKTNPGLKESLRKSQDYELAYYLAKNSDAYKNANQKQQRNEDAERILRNTQQSGSLSSLGASTPVGQAKRYKDMSEEEFRILTQKNMGY